MKTIAMRKGELAQANRALNELMKDSRPVRIGLALRRIARQLAGVMADLSAVEKQIIERHARRDTNGNFVTGRDHSGNLIDGSIEIMDPDRCRQELAELNATKVELPVEPITPEEYAQAGPDAPAWTWLALGELLIDGTPNGKGAAPGYEVERS